jgi:hypothetical protein
LAPGAASSSDTIDISAASPGRRRVRSTRV